jgi:hypothetical protein
MMKRDNLVSKYVRVPAKTSATEMHLAIRQFLLYKLILDKENSLIYRAETGRTTALKIEGLNLDSR